MIASEVDLQALAKVVNTLMASLAKNGIHSAECPQVHSCERLGCVGSHYLKPCDCWVAKR